jgi:hypothetical protein
MNDLQLVLSSPNGAKFGSRRPKQTHKEITMGETSSRAKVVYLYKYAIELYVEGPHKFSFRRDGKDSLRNSSPPVHRPHGLSIWPGIRVSTRKVDGILNSTWPFTHW